MPSKISLIPSQRESYLELHEYANELFERAVEIELGRDWDDVPRTHRKVLAIWAANAFSDIFLLGSRINHSCTPNSRFAYNAAIGKGTFHATRDIMAGEEVTVMYFHVNNRTRIERQKALAKW